MPFNPTDAQQAATEPVKAGETRLGYGLDGNIFASGVTAPEVSDFLSYRFPQYVATSMMNRLGNFEPCAQPSWSWFEQDRSRRSAEITAGVGALPATTLTLTTDIPAAAAGGGYFLPKDLLYTETSISIRVTAVGEAGGFQTITVVKQDGTDFAAGEIANNERIGHTSNINEEGSDSPGFREFLPTERRAALNKIRRARQITGDALTAKTYLNDGRSWYYEGEMIVMDEFATDQENAIMFNNASALDADPISGDGIVPLVEAGGTINTYANSVTEADIQNHITDLIKETPAKEFMVFCGSDFLAQVNQALRDYYVNGGIDFGLFRKGNIEGKMVGIAAEHYHFLGKMIHFIHYYPFDDRERLPYEGTPTATKVNYSKYSLWLNMESYQGRDLIRLKYRELDGVSRRLVYRHLPGVTGYGDNSIASTAFDRLQVEMLSEIGVELRNLNFHGVLKQTA